MGVRVQLLNQYSPWRKTELGGASFWIKGCLYHHNILLTDAEVAHLFLDVLEKCGEGDLAPCLALLANLNGAFAVVADDGESVVCSTDLIRGVPLFFKTENGTLFISDDAHTLHPFSPARPDEEKCMEFLLSGYVTGPSTLVRDVRQLPAGTCLLHGRSTGKTTSAPYFQLRYTKPLEIPDEDLVARLDQVCTAVFSRLLETTEEEGRHIVVPLSGGLDSRILVAMLSRLGARAVTCFSYGPKHNLESSLSRRVAEAVGYPWYFIEYTPETWCALDDSGELDRYFWYADNLASLPHVQDLPAVRELKERDLIPDHSVFVSGHGSDLLAGCKIPERYDPGVGFTADEVDDHLIDVHYSNVAWGSDPAVRRCVVDWIHAATATPAEFHHRDRLIGAETIDFFDFHERQAKYILNSMRVYEFYGYEWRLPYWDAEFIRFFLQIPIQRRIGQRLYKQFARERLFSGELLRLRQIECTTHFDTSALSRALTPLRWCRIPYDRICKRGIYSRWWRDLRPLLAGRFSNGLDVDPEYPAIRRVISEQGSDAEGANIIGLLNVEYLARQTEVCTYRGVDLEDVCREDLGRGEGNVEEEGKRAV